MPTVSGRGINLLLCLTSILCVIKLQRSHPVLESQLTLLRSVQLRNIILRNFE